MSIPKSGPSAASLPVFAADQDLCEFATLVLCASSVPARLPAKAQIIG
jgi:hypothetical protein